MQKKRSVNTILCGITIFVLLTLTACRPSPALQRIVYDNQANSTSTNTDNLEMIKNSLDSDKTEEDLPPVKKSKDTDDIRERKADKAGLSDENERQTNTEKKINSQTATSSKGERPDTENHNGAKDNKKDDSGEVEKKVAEDKLETVEMKEMIDATGKQVDVPTEVKSIGAVGEVAKMICMLGGGEKLIATSESLTGNELFMKVFQKELNKEVNTLWEADGSITLSDPDFSKLLELKPQVCIETSGEATLSEQQIKKLKSKGISYVVLYKMNTSTNIKNNVLLVAEMLGRTETVDALKLAKQYSEYYDTVTKDLSSKVDRATCGLIDYDNDRTMNGVKKLASSKNDSQSGDFSGKYSIFINKWDNNAVYTIATSQKVYVEGEGAAVTKSGYSYGPMSYYMSIAGVLNVPAMYADFGQTQNWYVNPLIPSTKKLDINGDYIDQKDYCLTLTDNDKSSNTTARTNGLGKEDTFPAVIVANKGIEQKLKKDPAWKTYDYIKATNGMGENFGFLDDEGGIIETSIIGNYEVFVNPNGAGSWMNGGVESILEPIWLANRFYNTYSDHEVKKKIKEFYKTFYRYSLSDSQVESILSGTD